MPGRAPTDYLKTQNIQHKTSYENVMEYQNIDLFIISTLHYKMHTKKLYFLFVKEYAYIIFSCQKYLLRTCE